MLFASFEVISFLVAVVGIQKTHHLPFQCCVRQIPVAKRPVTTPIMRKEEKKRLRFFFTRKKVE